MKVVFSGCAVLLIALISIPGYATERLVPYDDFNATHLDPNKWVGFESGGTGTEAIRQIQDNRLRLVYRGYAQETSDTGSLTANLGVAFPHPAAVTAIKATVQVSHLEGTGCPRHPQGTLTAARLGGYFFNTATPTPGSAVHDVRAVIGMARRSDSTDPPDVLGIGAVVTHCSNAQCADPPLHFEAMGPIKRGEMVRLRVQWDRDHHRFLFQRDDEPEVVVPYTLSDSAPPGLQAKSLGTQHVVPNCTATLRPMGFIEAWFDDVSVNDAGDVKDSAPTQPVTRYQYTVPEATKDGWETAHASGEHIDVDMLTALFDRVLNQTYKNMHSVLLVKNGKLVVEEYFQPWSGDARYRDLTRALDRVTIHPQHSVTKSVTSLLLGIAIDQQLIPSVEEKLATFFPEYADIFAERTKANFRLQHFLTMTANLAWDEWTHPYTDARNDHSLLDRSPDPIRYVLERPVVGMPGTQFVYNSGIAITLGEIIDKVSGLRADQFAERYLFAPLSISDYYWWKYPNGAVQTGGGLQLRSRDMAKIGELVLQGGRWQGKQIVSEAWIKESTTPHVRTGRPPRESAPEYGYQWWLGTFRVSERVIASYSARGRGGQFIFVFPDLQLVAVFTGWNDNALWLQPIEMLQQYILPAVR